MPELLVKGITVQEKYRIQWIDDVYCGKGMRAWPDGSRYNGDFRNGLMHGWGIFTWPDSSSYEGEWEEDLPHGRGVFIWPDGTKCEGEWAQGRVGEAQPEIFYESVAADTRAGRELLHLPAGKVFAKSVLVALSPPASFPETIPAAREVAPETETIGTASLPTGIKKSSALAASAACKGGIVLTGAVPAAPFASGSLMGNVSVTGEFPPVTEVIPVIFPLPMVERNPDLSGIKVVKVLDGVVLTEVAGSLSVSEASEWISGLELEIFTDIREALGAEITASRCAPGEVYLPGSNASLMGGITLTIIPSGIDPVGEPAGAEHSEVVEKRETTGDEPTTEIIAALHPEPPVVARQRRDASVLSVTAALIPARAAGESAAALACFWECEPEGPLADEPIPSFLTHDAELPGEWVILPDEWKHRSGRGTSLRTSADKPPEAALGVRGPALTVIQTLTMVSLPELPLSGGEAPPETETMVTVSAVFSPGGKSGPTPETGGRKISGEAVLALLSEPLSVSGRYGIVAEPVADPEWEMFRKTGEGREAQSIVFRRILRDAPSLIPEPVSVEETEESVFTAPALTAEPVADPEWEMFRKVGGVRGAESIGIYRAPINAPPLSAEIVAVEGVAAAPSRASSSAAEPVLNPMAEMCRRIEGAPGAGSIDPSGEGREAPPLNAGTLSMEGSTVTIRVIEVAPVRTPGGADRAGAGETAEENGGEPLMELVFSPLRERTAPADHPGSPVTMDAARQIPELSTVRPPDEPERVAEIELEIPGIKESAPPSVMQEETLPGEQKVELTAGRGRSGKKASSHRTAARVLEGELPQKEDTAVESAPTGQRKPSRSSVPVSSSAEFTKPPGGGAATFAADTDRAASSKQRGIPTEGGTVGAGGFLNLTLPDGAQYAGEVREDLPHGHGIMTYPDGSKYIGEWAEGRREGQGSLTVPDGAKYAGEWHDDRREGSGTTTMPDGRKYVGDLQNDRYEGRGIETFRDGTKYAGQFKEGVYHGQGILILPDGKKYTGQFKNGLSNGRGILTFPTGRYEGEFKDNKYHGQGTLVMNDGRKYTGQLENGLPHGRGVMILANGTKYAGEFANGRFKK